MMLTQVSISSEPRLQNLVPEPLLRIGVEQIHFVCIGDDHNRSMLPWQQEREQLGGTDVALPLNNVNRFLIERKIVSPGTERFAI